MRVLQNSQNPQVLDSVITAQGLAVNRSLGGKKIVFCIVCFAYSLLLVVAVVAIVVVFLLLSYQTVFISTYEFPLLSISPPHPTGGRGEVSEGLSSAQLPAARLNHGKPQSV